MTENCKVNDCQKRLLMVTIERLVRFLDEATDYELHHAADYSVYLDAKAVLDSGGSSPRQDIRK